MSSVPVSFTSATAGASLLVSKGKEFSYSISGTFVATLVLEKSSDNGNTWTPVSTFTAATIAKITADERALYRFNCTDFTSGTAVTTLEDSDTDILEQVQNANGDIIMELREDGASFLNDPYLQPVVAATTASGTLATAYAAGQSVDGITLAEGDRILVKDQSSAAENGIYLVNATGAPTRAPDADTGTKLADAIILCRTGTVNANTMWKINESTITPDTTSLTFTQFSGDRASQARILPAMLGKVGATSGFVVAAGADTPLVTVPASQTASTLVIPVPDLKTGDTITSFSLQGQIESAGNTVTVDAALRKMTSAEADVTDASVAAMTQISATADTEIDTSNSTKTLSEAVGADELFYLLVTVTTAASTDVALMGAIVTVTEAA